MEKKDGQQPLNVSITLFWDAEWNATKYFIDIYHYPFFYNEKLDKSSKHLELRSMCVMGA